MYFYSIAHLKTSVARLTNTGKTPCNDSNDGDEASVKNKYVKHLLLKVYDYEINSRL